jgi:DNA-binding NarL/FixJ family response regulator
MDDAARHDAQPIALDVDDEDLRSALAALVDARAEWRLAEEDEDRVAVTVTDRPDAAAEPGPRLVLADEPAGSDTVASADPTLILAAAQLIAAGYRIEAPAGWDAEPAAPPPSVALTARERQVLGLLAEGASNKVIARRLAISVHTAKFHVTAVLEKLGARNRADAVGIAMRAGHLRL